MFINAYDMGRFGLLSLNKGAWKGKQILSKQWIALATAPTPVQLTYGFMNYFLNTDKKYLPSAPATAFVHVGNGTSSAKWLMTYPLLNLSIHVTLLESLLLDLDTNHSWINSYYTNKEMRLLRLWHCMAA